MVHFKLTLLSIGIFVVSILFHTVISQDLDPFDFLDIFNESNLNLFNNNSTIDYGIYQASESCSTKPELLVVGIPQPEQTQLDLFLNTRPCFNGTCTIFDYNVTVRLNGSDYLGLMRAQVCLSSDRCRQISCSSALNMSDFDGMRGKYDSIAVGDSCSRRCCSIFDTCDDSTTTIPSVTTHSGVAPSCGYNITLSNSGALHTITSPGFPGEYPHSSNCVWRIRTQTPGNRISIVFLMLNTESTFDYLTIYNGNEEVLKVSGNDAPSPYSSRSDEVVLTFISDDWLGGTGFIVTLEEISTSTSTQFNELATDEAKTSTNFVNQLFNTSIMTSPSSASSDGGANIQTYTSSVVTQAVTEEPSASTSLIGRLTTKSIVTSLATEGNEITTISSETNTKLTTDIAAVETISMTTQNSTRAFEELLTTSPTGGASSLKSAIIPVIVLLTIMIMMWN